MNDRMIVKNDIHPCHKKPKLAILFFFLRSCDRAS